MDQPITVLTSGQLAEMLRQAARTGAELALERYEQKPAPELMTRAELAEYLRCSVGKIDWYVKHRALPVEHFGEQPRFRKSDIDAWLKAQ